MAVQNRIRKDSALDPSAGNAAAVQDNNKKAQELKTGIYAPGASRASSPRTIGSAGNGYQEIVKPSGVVSAKAGNLLSVADAAASYGGYGSKSEYQAATRLKTSDNYKSAREAEAAVWIAAGNDQVARDSAYAALDKAYNTPGSTYYNPYRQATNQSAINALAQLGIDASNGINDDFFKANASYMQYTRAGVAGSPLAPSKKSTKENDIAYYLYQLQKDEETTRAAESEWNDMVGTIRYWTQKGLSDDEVIAKAKTVNHATLDRLDAGRVSGVPVQLNRAVGYSEDAMYGAIWAARNGKDTGDYFSDAVRYTLGQGKGYAASSRAESERDVTSAAYNPYKSGSTMDDVRKYFGVGNFNQEWLNANKDIMGGADKKAQTMYQKVYAANETTAQAETELDALKKAIRSASTSSLASSQTPEEMVRRLLATGDYNTLVKMDKARESGDPVALTRSVNYRAEDMVSYARTLMQVKGKLTRGEAAAKPSEAQKTEMEESVPVSAQGSATPDVITSDGMAGAPSSAQAQNGPAVSQEEAAQTLEERVQAKADLTAQRQELIDRLTGYRSSEIKGYTLDKQKAETIAQINALTDQIGDGYKTRVDYTTDELRNVLSKVFGGNESLSAQEQAVFDTFSDEYHTLFGQADTQSGNGQYKYFGESSEFGKTAAEALTWADDKDATSEDMVNVLMAIAQDYQDAKADAVYQAALDPDVARWAQEDGVTPAQWAQEHPEEIDVDLDGWYESHPDQKADLLAVKDSVAAAREAKSQKAALDAEETKKANLAACADVMKTVAVGGTLSEQQQTVYDAIQSIPESTVKQDKSYIRAVEALYDTDVFGDTSVMRMMPENERDPAVALDYAVFMEDYYTKDAKVAAACGMTLDEMYEKFPQMRKSDEQLLQMARQDYADRWTVQDNEESKAGLGFWKTVGLGASSGAQDWWAGKVSAASATLDQRNNVTSAANYGAYVDKYGYANARATYRADVQKAIAGMPDGDRKTQYQQMLAASDGKDIFNLPFNFTVEQLNDYHAQIQANIQGNTDLVMRDGTPAEKNALYPVSRSVTSNNISMLEAAGVRAVTGGIGLPGASVLGTLAGYGAAQYGDTYWDAKGRGLSVDSARLLATVQTAITTALESSMLEKYVGGDMGEGMVAALTAKARKDGAGFLTKLGAAGARYITNAAGEALQENAENIASGAVNAIAYGDASEFTSQLDPKTVLETSAMSFITSLFLTAQGDLMQKTAGLVTGRSAETEASTSPDGLEGHAEASDAKAEQEQADEQKAVQEATQALAAVLESPDAMEQITQAAAGKLTLEKIGQGAMNAEAIQAATQRDAQAQETLHKADQAAKAARRELTALSGKLAQLTRKAGTAEGAQQIVQLTQQAAQVRERLATAQEDLTKAQAAADAAAQEKDAVRRGAYRQVQADARAEAQERIQAQAESAREMLAHPGGTTYNQATGGEVNEQQQTIEGADHQGELAVAPGRADGPGSVGLARQGERSGNPGDTEGLLGQGSGRVYPGFLSEKNPANESQAAGYVKPSDSNDGHMQEDTANNDLSASDQVSVEASPMTAVPQTNNADGMIPGGPASGATESQDSASGPQRQFGAQTAQESDAIHESVKDYLREHSAYDPQSDQTLIDKATDKVMGSDYNRLVADFVHSDMKTLNTPENQALAVVLMDMAAKNNDVRTELDIADTYNRMGTEAGRTLQARKIFDLMSPLGAVKYVQKTIGEVNSRYAGQPGKAGVTVSEDTIRRIGEAQTLEDRQNAVDAAMKEITAQIRPTLMDRLNSWRYLAMLGNPRTHIRNIIGNSVFSPAVAIKNKVAAAIETMFLKPGERTKSLAVVTDPKYREAAEQFYLQDKEQLKRGGKYETGSAATVDMREIEQDRRRWGNSPGGKLMEWLSEKNGQALKAEDLLFKKGYYTHALASYLQANHIDLETAGEDTLARAREYAYNEAQKNTYNNRSQLVKAINGFENDLRNMGRGGKVGAMLIEGAIPFKNTPVNILSRGLEYSPAGLAETLIVETGKLRKGTITASQYIDKLSAGMTGTGTFALGALLSSMGMLRASIPDDDEGKQLKLNGAQEYSLEYNGKSYTIDWTAPASIALFCGAEMQKILQGQGVSSAGEMLSAVSELTSPVMNLTMLSGLSNLFDNNSYDDSIGSLERVGISAMESYAGQFIPTLLGQIARVIDPVRRSNYTDASNGFDSSIQYFINKQRNKIPFLSTLSAPYVDAWGRQDVTPSVWQRMLENFASPGYLNDLTDDQVSKELANLAGESGDSGVYPHAAPKSVTVDGQKIKLSGAQWAAYQTGIGQTSRSLIEPLMNNSDFAGLDPAYQAEAVKDVYAYAKKVTQEIVTGGVTLAKWQQNAKDGDAVKVIVDRAKEIQTSDYKSASVQAMMDYLADGDAQSAQTCVDALSVLGLDAKQIKSAVASGVKTAWQNGDREERETMQGTLMELGLGFQQNEFDKWLGDMLKE